MRLPFGGVGRQQPKQVPRRRLHQQPTRPDSVSSSPVQPSAEPTFRRNRTLTGSTSESVQSSTELTGTMQSPRAVAHQLRRRRRRLGGLLLAGVIGASLVLLILLQITAELRIAVVGQVRPLTEAQQSRITQPINDYLAMRPLERLRVLLNVEQLQAHLQSKGVRDVEHISRVSNDGWGRTVIEVKVREPVARWSIAGQERFVDRSGAVFEVNYFDTPAVSIRDESGVSARSEAEVKAVTSSRFLAFVGQTVGLLKGYRLQIDSVVIPPATTRQVDLVIAGRPGTPVKMSIDRPAGEQAEDAARAYRHLLGQGGTAPKYIDVRVSGMAYYRR